MLNMLHTQQTACRCVDAVGGFSITLSSSSSSSFESTKSAVNGAAHINYCFTSMLVMYSSRIACQSHARAHVCVDSRCENYICSLAMCFGFFVQRLHRRRRRRRRIVTWTRGAFIVYCNDQCVRAVRASGASESISGSHVSHKHNVMIRPGQARSYIHT